MMKVWICIISAIAFQQIFCTKTPKCPDEFELFERNASARNNYTSHYCLRVVPGNKTYDFDVAASTCIKFGSVITTVESNSERLFVLFSIGVAKDFEKIANGTVAVDGILNPKCKDYTNVNLRKYDKECKSSKNLFLLTNPNTDPTYAFSNFHSEPPTTGDDIQDLDHEDKVITFSRIPECLAIADFKGSNKSLVDTPCHKPFYGRTSIGVLCGRHAIYQ